MANVIAGWIATIGGLVAAFLAVLTYRQNANVAKARLMKELYEKFYEKEELKSVRNELDGADEQCIAKLVAQEAPSFTDYLNFFEFLAYLEESGQVKRKDIIGIFAYYLEDLKSSPSVLAYIRDPAKGFEKLRKLLEGRMR
jgi:DNA-binding transcriptional regulator YbjK